MYLRITYESEFEDLWMYLKSKYPSKLFDLDGIGKQTDLAKFSKTFFSKNITTAADASIDANANVDDISVISYTNELKKPFEKLNSYYMLWRELKQLYGHATANEIIEMQLSGDIYIHDFHGVGAGLPYCYNYSTYDIMLQGLSTVKKIISKPPKHLYAFKSQIEQFVTIASNSTLGATGLADLLVIISMYVESILKTKSDAHFNFATENDCWNYIKENLVSMIYTINQPMRGNQSPFTNVSVYDDEFLERLCQDYVSPINGEKPKKEIVKQTQILFLDIMNEELSRTPITFPIVTACFSINEDKELQDFEFLKMIAETNKEYGFINIYIGKSSTLSSCCRLRSESDNEYFNSFGSGSSKIGSLGVVSINLPRLAIKNTNDKEKFSKELEYMVGVCAKINNAKRRIIKKRIDNGNHPLYSNGFINIKSQYSTVGVNGFNETIEIMGHNILTEEGSNLGVEIIEIINKINRKYQTQYKSPHNCEQVPGENMSIKMAEKDKLLGYHNEYNIYSNQFIPLVTQADLLDRIKLQGKFDKYFSGGSICHLNIEEKIEDSKLIEELILTCAKMGVIYFAINYNLQLCGDGHMSVGRKESCEVCGEPIVDNFTRVVGFLTNTKNWHQVRRDQDYPNRQWYEGSNK